MEQELFSTWTIGTLKIKNRLVRSATGERTAEITGTVTDEIVNIYKTLAEGGTGLIITGHAFVSLDGRTKTGQSGIHDDYCIEGLSKFADVTHTSDARILLQISHGGSRSEPMESENNPHPKAKGANDLSPKEIEKIRGHFIDAAVRAEKAGFDGIQIHGAHRYLLSDFLSPVTNTRDDEYGGREGGTRLVTDIIKGIRSSVSEDFVISIKVGTDVDENGNNQNDLLLSIKEFIRAGLDCVEISKGIAWWDITIKEKIKPHKNEAYNLDVALYIKKRLPGFPVIVVGGIRSIETAEDILRQGIDAVALCRPLIMEPDLPRRWMENDRRPSTCISCSQCVKESGAAICHVRKKLTS